VPVVVPVGRRFPSISVDLHACGLCTEVHVPTKESARDRSFGNGGGLRLIIARSPVRSRASAPLSRRTRTVASASLVAPPDSLLCPGAGSCAGLIPLHPALARGHCEECLRRLAPSTCRSAGGEPSAKLWGAERGMAAPASPSLARPGRGSLPHCQRDSVLESTHAGRLARDERTPYAAWHSIGAHGSAPGCRNHRPDCAAVGRRTARSSRSLPWCFRPRSRRDDERGWPPHPPHDAVSFRNHRRLLSGDDRAAVRDWIAGTIGDQSGTGARREYSPFVPTSSLPGASTRPPPFRNGALS
jgi:hypothetical protein